MNTFILLSSAIAPSFETPSKPTWNEGAPAVVPGHEW